MGRQAYGVWGIRMEKGDYLVGMATTPKPGVEVVTEARRRLPPARCPRKACHLRSR